MGGFYSLIGKVVSCDVVFLFNVFVFYEYNGNIDYVVMNGDGVFQIFVFGEGIMEVQLFYYQGGL